MNTKIRVIKHNYIWIEIDGKEIPNFWRGYSMLLHRHIINKSKWCISDVSTGRSIAKGLTQKDAINNALESLDKHGIEKYLYDVSDSLKREKEYNLKMKQTKLEIRDYDRYTSYKPITTDLVLDMVKIHTITTGDFK